MKKILFCLLILLFLPFLVKAGEEVFKAKVERIVDQQEEVRGSGSVSLKQD